MKKTPPADGLMSGEDLDRFRHQLADAVVTAGKRQDGKLAFKDLPDFTILEYLGRVYVRTLNRPKGAPNQSIGTRKRNALLNQEVPLIKAVDFLGALVTQMVRAPSGSKFVPGVHADESGNVRVHTVRPPLKRYRVPTSVLSATAEPPLYEALWQHVTHVITPDRPPRVVRLDMGGSRMSLMRAGELTPTGQASARMVEQLAHAFNSPIGPYDVLTVWQEAIEAAANADLHFEPRIATGHFGALEGLNRYEHVAAEIIFGRPLPTKLDLMPMAEAIQNAVIPFDGNVRWEVAASVGKAKDGSEYIIREYTHENDILRYLLRATCHAAVAQANRTRFQHRAENNPVTLIVANQLDMSRWLEFDTVWQLEDWVNWTLDLEEIGLTPIDAKGASSLLSHLLPDQLKDAKAARQQRNDRPRRLPAPEGWRPIRVKLPGKKRATHVAALITPQHPPGDHIGSLIERGLLPEGTTWVWRRKSAKRKPNKSTWGKNDGK